MTAVPGLTIVVEGATDAQLIRAILGEDLAKKVRFFAGQGLVSLATLGRNILFHEGGPILVVMDSHTLDPQLTAELQALTRTALASPMLSIAQLPATGDSGALPFRVFSFVPEIEAVLFEAPDVLGRIVGKRLPEEKVKEGRYVPKQVLAELLVKTNGHLDYKGLLERLDPKARQALAAGTQASNLKTAVQSLLAEAA